MGLLQDLRYAVRSLSRSTGFTAVALLMLGLAIGANTAIFQMIDALLLQALPVREPSRLVRFDEPSFSFPSYLSMRSQLSGSQPGAVFSDVLAVTRQQVRAAVDNTSESLIAATASGNFFDLLGVPAFRGRTLMASDDTPGVNNAVAVLSHTYWQRRFGGNPNAIGRRMELNRVPFTIVGVAAPDFEGPFVGAPTDLYVPYTTYGALNHREDEQWRTSYGWQWLHMLGRLAPGVSMQQANAAVKTTWPRVHTNGRDIRRNVYLSDGSGGISHLRRQYSQPLKVLLGATGLILLLACANLANLLFARMTARNSESALRLSLGASRTRLLRGYFAETLLLCVCGAVIGWVVSGWTIELLTTFLSGPREPIRLNIEANLRTLAFSAAACLITALLFGLAPALRASRQHPAALLQGHARLSGDRAGWLGRALVTVQIAISACLLIGSALLVQTLFRLTNQPAGFRAEGVLHVDLNLIDAAYSKGAMSAFYQRLTERVSGLPGVQAVGVGWKHPVAGGGWTTNSYRYSGGPAVRPDNPPSTHVNVIGPGYFAAIGARMLAGREFSWSDTTSRPPVVIVNEAFARAHWPNTSAIGQWFRMDDSGPLPYEVVGVTQSYQYRNFYDPAPPTVFMAFQQMPGSIGGLPLSLEVRSNNPAQMAPAIRHVIENLDPKLPADMELLTSRLKRAVGRESLLAWLSAILAILAFVITAVGLYGVVAFQLRRRTRELGLRMALGATPETLVTSTIRDGIGFLAFGLPLGLALAWFTSTFLASFLFGIQPHDLVTFAAVAAILIATTLTACWLPARWIIRADPAASLRYE
jgi:putative ABC transport system permease protein